MPFDRFSIIVQQMSVLHASVRSHIVASETNVLYTDFLCGGTELWEKCVEALTELLYTWPHRLSVSVSESFFSLAANKKIN